MTDSKIFEPPRIRLLGEGSSARVFESRDRNGEPAALKLSRGPEIDPLLEREGELSRRWTHPALLQVVDSGTNGEGRHWLLFPLLEGTTLQDWKPGDRELLDAMALVADALDLLHDAGFGHADLKAANLLVGRPDSNPLILGDLGLAVPLGKVAQGGTPAYLSPRRLGGAALDWRDDLHALAVLVFEVLAGALPWRAAQGEALLKSIQEGDLLGLSRFRPDLPGDLDLFFGKTLRAEGEWRSMTIWMDALRERFGLNRMPRSIFLVKPAPPPPADIHDRRSLRRWVEKLLRSGSCDDLMLGDRMFRLFDELSERDPRELERILRFAFERRLLVDMDGVAVLSISEEQFDEIWQREDAGAPTQLHPEENQLLGACGLANSLLDVSSLDPWFEDLDVGTALERFEALGLARQDSSGKVHVESGSPAYAGTFPRPPEGLLEELWRMAGEEPGRWARLIELAIRASTLDWILQLPQSSILALARGSSESALARLRVVSEEFSIAGRLRVLLTLMEHQRALLDEDFDTATSLFWEIEADLELEISGEVSRLLVYRLAASQSIRLAHELLLRWKEARETEYRGTMLEIQVAAREIIVLAVHGDYQRAESLADGYREKFAGRPGLWVLHMAEGTLASQRGDRAAGIRHGHLALNGLRDEDGPERMRLDLLIFLSERIINAGIPEEMRDLDALLLEMRELAARGQTPDLDMRIVMLEALVHVNRGELRLAEQANRKAIEAARLKGETYRLNTLNANLRHVLSLLGDYRRMREVESDLRAQLEGADDPELAVSIRRDLAICAHLFGDLEGARELLAACLPVITELDLEFEHAMVEQLLAYGYHIESSRDAAVELMDSSLARFRKLDAGRRVKWAMLNRIDIAPGDERDGEWIAEVIDYAEEIGDPRYLPMAWRLEGRRLRTLGELKGAALSLEQSLEHGMRLEMPEERWVVHREAAELALAAGDPESAAAELRLALEVLRDLSLHFPEGHERERFLARPDRAAVLTRLREIAN